MGQQVVLYFPRRAALSVDKGLSGMSTDSHTREAESFSVCPSLLADTLPFFLDPSSVCSVSPYALLDRWRLRAFPHPFAVLSFFVVTCIVFYTSNHISSSFLLLPWLLFGSFWNRLFYMAPKDSTVRVNSGTVAFNFVTSEAIRKCTQGSAHLCSL